MSRWCKGRVASDPVLKEIADAHGVGRAGGGARLPDRRGARGDPGLVERRDHLRANLAAMDVRLTPEEIERIRGLDRGERTINPAKSPRWDD